MISTPKIASEIKHQVLTSANNQLYFFNATPAGSWLPNTGTEMLLPI